MNTILSELDAWGCDVTGAMNRCFGDREFYLKWVSEFITDSGFEKLDNALERKDYAAAFQAAHGLKGDSGMLGLTPLLHAVRSIVEDLRKEEPAACLDTDYEIMKAEYEKLVNIVKHNR